MLLMLMLPVGVAQVGCVALAVGIEGKAVTVTVAVVETLAQPPVPVPVYVMTDVPAATALTAPVVAFIVATLGVAEDQAPPETLALKVVDPFAQIAVVPEIVPAEGTAVTVTVAVVVAFAQPPVPVTA
jgi:hypothetical protein